MNFNIIASMGYFILPNIAYYVPELEKTAGNFAVVSIIVRNLGATLASTIVPLNAHKINQGNDPYNPALALKYIDDFEVATVTTLTWQYFAVFIIE